MNVVFEARKTRRFLLRRRKGKRMEAKRVRERKESLLPIATISSFQFLWIIYFAFTQRFLFEILS